MFYFSGKLTNSVDLNQLTCDEASWSGSTVYYFFSFGTKIFINSSGLLWRWVHIPANETFYNKTNLYFSFLSVSFLEVLI